MLGKTAGGLYWMFRFLERAENTARLIEAGFRMALTRSSDASSEWQSVLQTAGVRKYYDATHDDYDAAAVVNFLLRDPKNPSAVLAITKRARDNARLVRTALTTEVWTAVNDNWMTMTDLLKRPVREVDLPDVLATIRQQSALVRGAMYGTMLRNDIYDFSRLGTHIERAENTARILDVKYYTLLPASASVGGRLDNKQWETILRSVSAHRSFGWLDEGDMTATSVTQFLILDLRLPRSLAFSVGQIVENLNYLAAEYGDERESHGMARALYGELKGRDIADIFDQGLHEFLTDFISRNNALGGQIERDYRFVG